MESVPVPRNLDERTTVMGLEPPEWIAVFAAAMLLYHIVGLGVGALVGAAGTAAGLRAARRGRPPRYWQDLVAFYRRSRCYAAGSPDGGQAGGTSWPR